VIQVRLRGLARKLKRLLAFVANHHRIAAGFAAASSGDNGTRTDRKQQDQGKYQFHESLQWVRMHAVIRRCALRGAHADV
jgi:hypothetical protein